MEKLEWRAPEYIHTEKTGDWYWIAGIITISVALIAIILNNAIFGVLIIISAFTLTLFATRKPQTVTITINEKGIKINKTDYSFSDFESFWVETRDAYPRIFFKLQKKMTLHIIVMLGDGNAEKIREKLSKHLEEKEYTEPLLEKILIYLGF